MPRSVITASNRVPGLHGVGERVDARLAAVGGDHFVFIELERIAQRAQQQRIVVDEQQAQRPWRRHELLFAGRHAGRSAREDHAHGGAAAKLAVDLEVATMTLHHAEHR